MLYTIYQVTHIESNKIYVGKHQTMDLDDGYMGSGNLIRRAIKKYGLNAFKKEVLFIFETEVEMNTKEAELVTNEFCLREDTYNICPGGHGGWGYVNANILTSADRKRNGSHTYKGPKRKPYTPTGNPKGAPVGDRNYQFGKRWIHKEDQVSQILLGQEIPSGWSLGKKPKPLPKIRDYSAQRVLAETRYIEFKKTGLSMRKYAVSIGVSQPNLSQTWKKYELI